MTQRFFVFAMAFAGMIGLAGLGGAQERPHLGEQGGGFVQEVEPRRTYDQGDCKWRRSFRAADGTIYLAGGKKTTDGCRTIIENTGPDLTEILANPERIVFVRPGLFYAVGSELSLESPGVYRGKAWRLSDDLKTLQKETAIFEVPDGPTRDAREG